MTGRTILLLILLLAGCTSSEPRLHTLVMVPGAVLAPVTGTVAIRTPVLPHYADRREIVRQQQGDRMQAAQNDWWSEPLADMVQRTLAADLAQRLPGTQVIGNDGLAANNASVAVEVELQRFDADPDQVVLTGFATIIPSGKAPDLRSLSTSAAVTGKAASGAVQAMSSALGTAADEIAKALASPVPQTMQ